MNEKECLMIRTKDRRRFFTARDNYETMAEFSKVFNAEVSLVRIQEAEVLDLTSLIPAICNASYRPTIRPRYELVEVKIPQKARKLARRRELLKTAKRVKDHILATFQAGGVVVLHELMDQFKGLSISCLCNHVRRVKKELGRQGKKFVKVKAGCYTVKK